MKKLEVINDTTVIVAMSIDEYNALKGKKAPKATPSTKTSTKAKAKTKAKDKAVLEDVYKDGKHPMVITNGVFDRDCYDAWITYVAEHSDKYAHTYKDKDGKMRVRKNDRQCIYDLMYGKVTAKF